MQTGFYSTVAEVAGDTGRSFFFVLSELNLRSPPTAKLSLVLPECSFFPVRLDFKKVNRSTAQERTVPGKVLFAITQLFNESPIPGPRHKEHIRTNLIN